MRGSRDSPSGQQQRVEILKALYRERGHPHPRRADRRAHAAGGDGAVRDPRAAQAEGISIIFISHKLNEVLEIADRITVLRRGKMVDTIPREGATEEELARLMVGRDVLLRVEKEPREPGGAAARGRATSTSVDDRGLEAVRGVSFEVRARRDRRASPASTATARRELIEALDRPAPPERGPIRRRRASIAGEPRERSRRGRRPHTRGPAAPRARARLQPRREPRARTTTGRRRARGSAGSSRAARRAGAQLLIEEFDVRGGGAADARQRALRRQPAEGRPCPRDRPRPEAAIAAQPTRGLDVGAIEFVHRRLIAERDEGRAILLVSLELEEILSLSDRILVIYEGRIVGEFPPTATRGGARHRDDRRRARRPGGRRVTATVDGAARASRRRRARTVQATSGVRRALWRCCSARAASATALITALVAFVDRRLRGARSGPQPAVGVPADLQRHRSQLAVPVGDGRGPDVRGAQPAADADHRDPPGPDGSRGRLRVPVRPVQHRRPGAVRRRLDHGRLGRARRGRRGRARRTSSLTIVLASFAGALFAGIAGLPARRPSARTR